MLVTNTSQHKLKGIVTTMMLYGSVYMGMIANKKLFWDVSTEVEPHLQP